MRRLGSDARTRPRSRTPAWCASKPPIAGIRRWVASRSQFATWPAGRASTRRSASRIQRSAWRGVLQCSAASVRKLQSSMPVSAGSSSASQP